MHAESLEPKHRLRRWLFEFFTLPLITMGLPFGGADAVPAPPPMSTVQLMSTGENRAADTQRLQHLVASRQASDGDPGAGQGHSRGQTVGSVPPAGGERLDPLSATPGIKLGAAVDLSKFTFSWLTPPGGTPPADAVPRVSTLPEHRLAVVQQEHAAAGADPASAERREHLMQAIEKVADMHETLADHAEAANAVVEAWAELRREHGESDQDVALGLRKIREWTRLS